MNNLKLITDHPKYLLLVDEKDRQWGKVAYNVDTKEVEFICSHPKYDEHGIKIVAHLPKAGAPLLKGVMLMVDLPLQEDEDEKRASKYADSRELREKEWFLGASGYMDGYKAASKQYTEEDLLKAYKTGWYDKESCSRGEHAEMMEGQKEFIASLSPVPVLPVDFMIEYQQAPSFNDFMPQPNIFRPKTISNEQGVEVLQGKWIY